MAVRFLGAGATILAVRIVCAFVLTLLAWPGLAGDDVPASSSSREVSRRSFGGGQLRLVVDGDGTGTLLYSAPGLAERALYCDRLEGAWGLWVGDVEGDGSPEAIVTLRKKAKHDPVVENRLHVYAIEDGRCVPVWRGTRLAGRFDWLAVDGDRLLAFERVQAGRRVAWYRWHGFGYRLEETLWQGTGMPGAKLMAMFAEGKAR